MKTVSWRMLLYYHVLTRNRTPVAVRPYEDSNLDFRLRRPALCPLSYRDTLLISTPEVGVYFVSDGKTLDISLRSYVLARGSLNLLLLKKAQRSLLQDARFSRSIF